MDDNADELVRLYQELSEHTKTACEACPQAEVEEYRCCYPEACEMAIMFASWKGVTLTRTDHPTLPLMGKGGCTVAPHLRPMCTGYVCPSQKTDPEWMSVYIDIRNRIQSIEGA